jgi:hypothetical protein
MDAPLPPGDYYAVGARGERLPVADVYAWTIRHTLPTIPVPLRPPDPDVQLMLAELVTRVYDLGRYAGTLHYDRLLPVTLPLAAVDRDWAQDIEKRARS